MLINNSQSSQRHHIKVNALIHLKKLCELLIIFKRVNVANYGCGPCDIRHIVLPKWLLPLPKRGDEGGYVSESVVLKSVELPKNMNAFW